MENVLAVSDTITAKETMTSLEIAEVTGRQHSNVLRDIRNMAEKLNQSTNSDVNALNFKDDYHRGDRTQYKFLSEKTQNYILDFAFGGKEESPYQIEESTYKDEKGECRTLYKLNKKACFLLASGYDTLLRAKIINRWEQLEIEKRNGGFAIPKTYSAALMLAAKQAKEIEENQKLIGEQQLQIGTLNNKVVELQEKSDYVEKILQSKETITVTQIAQDYGMSAKAFNLILRNIGIQHKVNRQWILYSKYISEGYVYSHTINIVRSDGRPDTVMNTEWRQKGRLFLYEELKKHGFLPLIEQ